MKTRIAFVPQISSLPSSAGLVLSHLSIWHQARKLAILAVAPLAALLFSSAASAQSLHIAGQLLIDLNAARGTTTATGASTVAGETSLITWTNYGTLGGAFTMVNNSPYAAGFAGSIATTPADFGITNPPEMVRFPLTGTDANGNAATAPMAPATSSTVDGRSMWANFATPASLLANSNWSVECWFYTTNEIADPRGVFAWTPDAGITAGTDSGTLGGDIAGFYADSAHSLNWSSSAAALPTYTWVYGVLTYDGVTLRSYLQGALTDSRAEVLNIVNPGGTINPSLFMAIGANPPVTGSGALNGGIAAVRVHTEALGASDVASNYLAGLGAVPAAPTNSISTDSGAATVILGHSATVNGILNATTSLGTTKLIFFYDTKDDGNSTNAWPNSVTAATPVSVPGTFSANLTGLTLGTTYYVRIYAVNSGATNMSSFAAPFVTQSLPVVANGGAFFTAPTQDTLTGTLVTDGTSGGGAYVTVYWGPSNGGTNPASWANSAPVGNSAVGQIQAPITGLTPLGNYYFTVQATNQYGTNWATPSVAFQEGLILSLNTTNLPAVGALVTNYPSSAGLMTLGNGGAGGASGTPVVQDFGGVPWLSEAATPADNLYIPSASFPGGSATGIPVTGGTVVAALEPSANGNGGNWENVVAVFFSQLGLGMGPTTTTFPGGSVASVTIATGGSNYATAPTVTFSAPGGIAALDSTATGTAVLGTGTSAGKVVSVTITSGGSGYPYDTGTATGDVLPPTVTFTGGGGSNAAATAVMTSVSGLEVLADVNSFRPLDDAIAVGSQNARNNRGRAFLPFNVPSIVSLVAGSGASSGTPGDNNYRLYINGILVEDTDWGYVTGVTFGTNGFGYTSAPTVVFPPPTAPGGTQATGVAVLGTGTNAGHIASVTITSPGSGYTGNGIATIVGANPVVTFTGGGASTPATGFATGVNLGLYSVATGAFGAGAIGANGGGVSPLPYPIVEGTGYGPNSTFCIGNDGLGIDPWSGFLGYLGDVYVYASALTDGTRQALENQLAAKFVTAATLTYSITASTAGAGTGTITAPGQNGAGVTTIQQGLPLTYTITAAAGGNAISGVTVDGVSVGTVSSYTFTNISANHTIVASFAVVPPQTITSSVTGSTGGNITPLGLVNVGGGGSQFFSIQPSNGFVVTTLTVDGTNITNPFGTTPFNNTFGVTNPGYTFVNLGGNGSGPAHTIAVTFAALSGPEGPSVPKSDQLIFSLSTGSLPTTNAGPITTWPVYAPSTIAPLIVREATAKTFLDANGTIWEQNVEIEDNTTETEYQIGATTSTTVTPIPITGATIILAANPTGNPTTGIAWNQIVSFFYNDLVLGIRNDNSAIQVGINQTFYNSVANPNPAPYTVPLGTNVVLSLVVQPSGAFAVYANTVMVFTNAGPGAITTLHNAVGQTYGNNIEIGGDGTDPWPNFNGLIGDVFVYGTALSNTDRTTLEAALMTKFHAVVNPNYNWVGANNANWSSVTSWSNTIPLANNAVPALNSVPVFSLTNTAGQTVQVDQPGITVAGLSFNTNGASTIIASTSGNALTLDSGSKGTSASITINSNASPTISDALNVQEGLTINGPGSLTLSGNVSTGDLGSGSIGANATSGLMVVSGSLTLSSNVTVGSTSVIGYLSMAHGATTATVTQTGGTVTTFPLGEDWTGSGYGPGVGLGGYNNVASSATYNLNGGILIIPDIGCVTSTGSSLVPPSTYGATAILNLNGGILQAAGNDLTTAIDATAVTEGSDHLIFNTTHTWVNAGGAIINTGGYTVSIAVPLEHYPSGPDIDGGLTVMGAGGFLTNLSTATYTGTTRVESGTLVCMLTNSIGGNVVDIDDGGVLDLNFTGTTKVYVLTLNEGSALPPGTYGANGSGATTIDNTHFAGTGTVTVLGTLTNPEKPNFTATLFSGSVVGGTGSITLSGTGGIPGGTFEVIGSTNASIPVTNWTTIATGTFTSSGFSISVPVTTNVPQEFLKVVAP